jgi:5-formyltetrahydrofolate cyclo-ligase
MPTKSVPTKTELRRHFRTLRRSLHKHEQQDHALAITRTILCSPLVLQARRIGLYIASDGEPDTTELILRLWALQKETCLPVIQSLSHRLGFYHYEPRMPLMPGRFDIPVPPLRAAHVPLLSIDVLLMPLVAFDHRGTRMGMGGGFYDRTLGPMAPGLRPLLIGIAHECQHSTTPLPRAAHDVLLDGIVTEAGLRYFRHHPGTP